MSIAYQLRGLLVHDRDGSYATQRKRIEVLSTFFRDLRTDGYRLQHIGNLKAKHIRSRVEAWLREGLGTGTIKNRLAIVRWLAEKLGRAEMVPTNEALGVGRRVQITGEDKAWPAVGSEAALAAVRGRSEVLYWQMRLQRNFGLRFKEAACLRPHENDQGDRLEVVYGTKGGRRRFVPIASAAQRALLDAIKARIPRGLSMTPPGVTFEAWRTRADAIFRALGLTKAARRNPHAQRHAYAQGRYRELTGHEAPCRQGAAPRGVDREAREVIAEELGHGRADVTSNYLGSPPAPDEVSAA